MLTELDAINVMLSAIGESPVSTLDSLHPDVLSSKLLLKQARYEVLSAGRWFNTERNITLNLSSTNEILLPANCIDVDPVDTSLDYVQRGVKLYNTTKHSFYFDAPAVVDMILDMPFDELPFVAQNLVMYNAAHALQANFVGDERKLQNLATRFEQARREFNKAEIKNLDVNARKSPTAKRLLGGFRNLGVM